MLEGLLCRCEAFFPGTMGRREGEWGCPHGAPLICTLDSLRSSRWSLLADPVLDGLQGSHVLYGRCFALPWLMLS